MRFRLIGCCALGLAENFLASYTANPIARYDFSVGIGYDDSIAAAQSEALTVLREHPAVIDDPEPLVLVESLGAATIVLRIYFWVDITRYSSQKVRSAVIRLTKRAFINAGITMPDEAREVVFPQGVPVHSVAEPSPGAPTETARHMGTAEGAEGDVAQPAEGNLASEAGEIERQAQQARRPEGGVNLLES
jgi:small conductance mechanosensitive channel